MVKEKKEILVHIEGDRYFVKASELQIAEFAAEAVEEFTFSNPRHFKPGMPGVAGEGFDRHRMKELRDAIKESGLMDPLCVRTIEKEGETVFQLVAGERRFRSCSRLAEENDECYNPRTGEKENGSDLYEYVECRLFENMSDRDAMKIAFLENSTSVGIGESANFNLFRYWRSHGFTDDEIMEMTKKTAAWVRHMDIISGLDEETLRAYCNDEINQTVALHLADVESVEERIEILKTACQFARDRAKGAIEKATQEWKEARSEAEKAEGRIVVAKHQEDEEAVQGAQVEAADANEKASKKFEAVKQKEKGLQVKNKDLVQAAKKVTGKPPKAANTALRGPAISKYVLDPLKEIIENDGMCQERGFIAPVEVLEIVNFVAIAINEGDKELIASLQKEYGNQEDVDAETVGYFE